MSDLLAKQRVRLEQLGQAHLLRFLETLGSADKKKFLRDLAAAELELVLRLYLELVVSGKGRLNIPSAGELSPAPYIPLPEGAPEALRDTAAWPAGEALMRAGKVACLMVAGGQGSRLGFDGPKGTFPLGPVSRCSLFEIQAHKVLAASRRYRTSIPLYIMVSHTNAAATEAFFKEHGYFGLRREEVVFFCQASLPVVDEAGSIILAEKGALFMSPDGHGGAVRALKTSGALEDMKRRGIEHVSYFQVDNPLVRAVDPYFLGLHSIGNAEMSIKVLKKREALEKVGNVVSDRGRLRVIEYSDFPAELAGLRDAGGGLRFSLGSIAIHAFRTDFLQRLSDAALPYHAAYKKITYIDEDGIKRQPEKETGYKFETFIFDALVEARSTLAVETAREFEFSPVKNAAGASSPETSRRGLVAFYKRMLRLAGAGEIEDNTPLEISPLCGMDAVELKAALETGCCILKRNNGIVVIAPT